MAIISQIRDGLAAGESLLRDWKAAGLAKPSVLKPLIATLEKDRIVMRLGQLSAADRQRPSVLLESILGEQK